MARTLLEENAVQRLLSVLQSSRSVVLVKLDESYDRIWTGERPRHDALRHPADLQILRS